MQESSLYKQIVSLSTEQRNPLSNNIDIASTSEILSIINNEDQKVAPAIAQLIPLISQIVDEIYKRVNAGGRVFYFGAGTSGRLGILDAAEIPPTFGTQPELFQAFIAGGSPAVFQAVEGAEDDFTGSYSVFSEKDISEKDTIIGLAASGRTPYVIGALEKGKNLDALTILISTAGEIFAKEIGVKAEYIVSPLLGAEVVRGSTRMKSGTAQKLILNMISTALMIKSGKVYDNVMIDLQLKNAKLVERAKATIMETCTVDYARATQLLELSGNHVKTAILMELANINYESAIHLLQKHDGNVKRALAGDGGS